MSCIGIGVVPKPSAERARKVEASMPDRRTPGPGWSDQQLVEKCLEGQEAAWSALVDKYKNLVYSIVLKYHATTEEAADVFQSVWLDAYHDMAKLRDKAAVRAWLISLTNHKCFHWKKRQRRQEFHETNGIEMSELEDHMAVEPAFAAELERDQLVREAIFSLSPRCQEMVRLLFFTSPPLPYKEVAERLGLAIGSIGFIRGRCLQRLQKSLEKQGF